MSTPATVVDISVELQKAAAWELNPPDWREQAREIARAHGCGVVELLRRRVEASRETAALTKQLRHMSRLLAERVQPGGGWLSVKQAAAMVGISDRALYRRMQRDPHGQLARCASRLGHSLRFDRRLLEEALRARPVSLRSARGPALIPPRASSPAKKESSR